MSFTDDFYYEPEADIEDLWREGKHETKHGDIIEIKRMRTDHIVNTIKLFKLKSNNIDTYPLKEELRIRKLYNLK